MRRIHLKKQYDLYIKEVKQHIRINPLERIKKGLKTTTYRMHPLKLENYGITQGSRFKPELITDIYLEVYQVEPIPCSKLTVDQIQDDLGLTKQELAVFLQSQRIPQMEFFIGMKRINGISKNKMQMKDFDEPYYLCSFKVKNG